MKRSEEKKKQKRNALLKSAYELFTTIGYHKTTIMAIALKAGVAKGTFYLYFKDKEDIRDALIVAKSSQILRSALDAMNQSGQSLPPVEKLIFLVDYIIDVLARDIALLRFVSKNLSWSLFINSGRYHQSDEDALDFRAFLVEMLETDGVPVTREMELTIFTIIELINSTCYSVILNGEPVTLSEYKPFLYDRIRLLFAHQ